MNIPLKKVEQLVLIPHVRESAGTGKALTAVPRRTFFNRKRKTKPTLKTGWVLFYAYHIIPFTGIRQKSGGTRYLCVINLFRTSGVAGSE